MAWATDYCHTEIATGTYLTCGSNNGTYFLQLDFDEAFTGWNDNSSYMDTESQNNVCVSALLQASNENKTLRAEFDSKPNNYYNRNIFVNFSGERQYVMPEDINWDATCGGSASQEPASNATTPASCTRSSRGDDVYTGANGYTCTVSNDAEGNVTISFKIKDEFVGLVPQVRIGDSYPHMTFADGVYSLTLPTKYNNGDEITFSGYFAHSTGAVSTQSFSFTVGTSCEPEQVPNEDATWTENEPNYVIVNPAAVYARGVNGAATNKANIVDNNITNGCQLMVADSPEATGWVVLDLGYKYDITKISVTTSGDRNDKKYAIYFAEEQGIADNTLQDGATGGANEQIHDWTLAYIVDNVPYNTRSTQTKAVNLSNVRYIMYKSIERQPDYIAQYAYGVTINEIRIAGTTNDLSANTPDHITVTSIPNVYVEDVANLNFEIRNNSDAAIAYDPEKLVITPIDAAILEATYIDGHIQLTAKQAGTTILTIAYEGGLVATPSITIKPYAPAAPVPTHNAENVLSIYSDTYGGRTDGFIWADWGGCQMKNYTVEGNEIHLAKDFRWMGSQFNAVDVTEYTYMHIDLYLTKASTIGIIPITTKEAGGNNLECGITTAELAANQWHSLNIDMTDFINNGVVDLNRLYQIKYLLSAGNNTKDDADGSFDVFFDNIYFYKIADDTEAPTNVTVALDGEVGATSAVLAVSATDDKTDPVVKFMVSINDNAAVAYTAVEGKITLENLEMQKAYSVVVTAKDEAGNESEASEAITFTTTFDANANLALNKPTATNSDKGGGYAVRFINDGNTTSSGWTADAIEPYAMIDLEAEYNLSSLVMYLDNTNETPKNFIFRGSLDNATWYDLTDHYTSAPAYDANKSVTYNVTGTFARYIKLQVYNNNNSVYIEELEVYGTSRYVADGKPVLVSATPSEIGATSAKITLTAIDTDTDADQLVYTLVVAGVTHTQTGNPVFELTDLAEEQTYSFTATVSDGTNTSAEITGTFATADKWATIEWIPDGLGGYSQTFMTDIECGSYVNIQDAGDGKRGIYFTMSNGNILSHNLGDAAFVLTNQMWVNPDKLLLRETPVHVVCENGECDFTIYKDGGMASLDAPTNVTATLSKAYITYAELNVSAEGGDGTYKVNGKTYTAVDGKIMVSGLAAGEEQNLSVTAMNNIVESAPVIVAAFNTLPNLAPNGEATATMEIANAAYHAQKAADDDVNTYWDAGLNPANPTIWTLDLKEEITNVNTIEIAWDGACSTDYDIEYSLDGTIWTTLLNDKEASNNNRNRVFVFENKTLRYVRLYCREYYNPSVWGLKLKEFRMNGTRPEMAFNALTLAATGSNSVELTPVCVGADHYMLKVNDGEYATAEIVSNGNIQVRGLAENTAYTFSVKAVKADGTASEGKTVENITTYTNYALQSKGAVAHANEMDHAAVGGIDGNEGSLWNGNYANNQDRGTWYQIDFQGTYSIRGVEILWEAAHSKAFEIQYSLNGLTWTTAATITNFDLKLPGGLNRKAAQIISFEEAVTAQYIRLQNHENVMPYNINFYEFRVFGEAGQTKGDGKPAVVYHNVPSMLPTNGNAFVYARQFTHGQWNTLYLPFEVDHVAVIEKATGDEYDIVPDIYNEATETLTHGHFLLKTFEGEKELAEFGNNWTPVTSTTLAKKTPYIIQFPAFTGDEYYNNAWILFYANAQTITAGVEGGNIEEDNFALRGNPTLAPMTPQNTAYYQLNSETNYFELSTDPVPAFECYVAAHAATAARMPRLSLDGTGNDQTTSVNDHLTPVDYIQMTENGMQITVSQLTDYQLYTVSGILMEQGSLTQGTHHLTIPQGLYLLKVNGNCYKIMR